MSGPAVQSDYARRAGHELPMDQIVARRHHDPHADAALDVFLDAYARGLANVIDVLDPSAIVLGGGLSNVELLYTEGEESYRFHAWQVAEGIEWRGDRPLVNALRARVRLHGWDYVAEWILCQIVEAAGRQEVDDESA